MREDPIALLERELVAAARRRAVIVDERDGSHEPRGPWPSAPRPARRRSSLGAFAAVALSGLAVAVGLGALVSLHGQRRPSPRPAAAKPIPGRRQLIDILGVLRRPQTHADLASERWIPPQWGAADTSLIRRAAVTPWGAPVVLIPVKPSIAGQPRVGDTLPPRGAIEGVVLEVGSAGICCATATDIATGGEMMTEGAGRSFAGGSARTRLIALVPDGVASVEFVLPRFVMVPVYDNVAAVEVNQGCCAGSATMIWRAPNGHVINEVGGPVPRVAAPPHPGPETALSRAAKRNPSMRAAPGSR